MKKILFALILGFICLPGFAQTFDLDKADLELSSLYDELRTANWEAKDTLVPNFTNKLYTTLENPESFNYSFDSLSTKIYKVTSPNKKVKIWSWDEFTGGTWDKNMTAVQFLAANEKLGFRQLNSGEEMMLGGYTDVYILKIFEIEEGGEVYYLTFGRGTHGSGNYHRIAQVFTIKDDEFLKCEPCFEGESDLVLEAWRGDEIELEFESATNTISHTVLVHDEMRDRSYATDKIQNWKFVDGSFSKSK